MVLLLSSWMWIESASMDDFGLGVLVFSQLRYHPERFRSLELSALALEAGLFLWDTASLH